MKRQRGFLSKTTGVFGRLSLLWADPADEAIAAEPSEVRFRRLLLTVLMLVGPPILLFGYYRAMFPGLTNPEALDLAQLGRNLSAGRGFVTYVLRPLALTHGNDALRQPDLVHGPLYPFFLAVAFGALGTKDAVAMLVSGIFYLLTIPVVYLLGVRVFDRKVGLLTALIFTFNALTLEYAASGMSLTLAIFLMTSLMLVIYQLAVWARNTAAGETLRFPRGQIVLAGVLTGALYLTDPIFFWVMPISAGAVIWIMAPRRWPAVLAFMVPMCLVALPWMARNAMLTGNPVFALRGSEVWMNTGKDHYDDLSGYRVYPTELTLGVSLFRAVVQKILLETGLVIEKFPEVTASWVLAFFLPALLFRFRDPATNTLRRVMMYSFLGLLLGMLLFWVEMPIFVTLIPTMLIYSVAFLIHLVQQAQLNRSASAMVTALVIVGVGYPLLSAVTLVDKPGPLPGADMAKAMGKATQSKELALSDQPWIVAWHSDRPAVWIPVADENISKLRADFPGLRYLFLTQGVQSFSDEWRYVYGNLAQWNVGYSQLPETDPRRRQRARIGPTPDLRLPLLTELKGFTSVPPLKDASLESIATVVAELPQPERKVGAHGAPDGPLARGADATSRALVK